MARVRRDKPRGVLGPPLQPPLFHLERYLPPDDLAPHVEHYWTVAWDLGDAPPRTQETLPHPSVHLVFEEGRSEIVGVMRGKFARELAGRGRVFAVKFRPGGFHAFLGAPVATITDRTLAVDDVFSVDVAAATQAILGARDDDARIAQIERVLRSKALDPAGAPLLADVTRAVEAVEKDPGILRVGDLVERVGIDTRALQRLFRTYVGVSPKWVIRRFRLLEAAERLAGEGAVSLADLSASLGYFDQAHFIQDFRSIVGATPGVYARRVAAGKAAARRRGER